MVATGTGVAPFRSMLHAVAECAMQPMALLFGVRDEPDILYRDEFEGLAQLSPLFSFYPILSRANPRFSGKRGHVQMHLNQVLIDLGGTNCDVYVCGLAKMVQDVRRILLQDLGVERKSIHIERYD